TSVDVAELRRLESTPNGRDRSARTPSGERAPRQERNSACMSAHAAADHEHELVYPEDPLYSRITAGKVGMWIFLLSDGFSFGGLLLAYGILRGGSDYWQCTEGLAKKGGCALEPPLGINFTALLTFILICSSVTMVLAH